MDIIYGLIYICVVVVASSAFGVANKWRKLLSIDDLYAYVLVSFFSFFFFVFHMLGALELVLHWPTITIVNAVILAAVLFAALMYTSARQSSMNLGTVVSLSDQVPQESLRFMAKFAMLSTSSSFVLLAALLMIGFPRGFEVSAYHLPIAINIFRDGSLRVWDRAYMHTFPANMSIWDGFWLQILPERLVSVINLPYLAMCVFFLYRLCRFSGADRSAGWLMACGLTTIPLFGFSSLELGADIGGVAFVLASTYFVLAQPCAKPGWPVMAGLAAGVAYGFKSLHMIPVVLLVLLIISGLYRVANASFSERLAQTLKFAVAFMATSGVWMLRNQLELGNPIYPIHFGVLSDLVGFSAATDFVISDRARTELEWVHASWEWLIYPWVEWHEINQNFKHSSGLGAFFAATVPVAWCSFGVMLLSDGRQMKLENANRVAITLFALGTFIFLAWWMLGDRQPRYVMAGIALLLPLAAVLITGASEKLRRAYETVLLLGIVFMLAVLLVRLGIAQGSLLSSGRLPDRATALEYPALIDQLDKGAVILNIERRVWNYPIYGSRLLNRVVSYSEAERLFRQGDSWNFSVAFLRRLGVTHVYAHGMPKLVAGCVRIEPEAKLERNPFNGAKLDAPRVLYRVIDSCPP